MRNGTPGVIRTPDPLLRRQTNLSYSFHVFHIFHGLTPIQGTCFRSEHNPFRLIELNFGTFWAQPTCGPQGPRSEAGLYLNKVKVDDRLHLPRSPFFVPHPVSTGEVGCHRRRWVNTWRQGRTDLPNLRQNLQLSETCFGRRCPFRS